MYCLLLQASRNKPHEIQFVGDNTNKGGTPTKAEIQFVGDNTNKGGKAKKQKKFSLIGEAERWEDQQPVKQYGDWAPVLPAIPANKT